jgi:hypothetical protein
MLIDLGHVQSLLGSDTAACSLQLPYLHYASILYIVKARSSLVVAEQDRGTKKTQVDLPGGLRARPLW